VNFARIREESKKTTSCGVILVDKKTKNMLVAHPTGKRYGPASFDIPKGGLEPDEDARECMTRELYEETAIVLTGPDVASAVDLGVVPYTSYKDLHLFYLEIDVPPIDSMKCVSTWDDDGTPRPEVNEYRMIPLDDLSLLFKSLQASVKTALTHL
jgi:8-oxo-dGTP pyrophosphatase MutT (NUDIX family)